MSQTESSSARPLKALIVDDEAPARSELRYLLEEAGDVLVVGEATSGAEALQLIGAIHYDVVFLDIEMPGLSGVDLAARLAAAEPSPAVVFVTAHSRHAVKAFEVAATDYLVKPVELTRLRQAVCRVRRAGEAEMPAGVAAAQEREREASRIGVATQERGREASRIGVAGRAAGRPSPAGRALVERIPVERAGRKLLVSVESIDHVVASDDYTYVHTGSERYLSNLTMAALEERLAPFGFFRVHRRHLVNLARVVEVVPMYGGTLLLTLGEHGAVQIPVSRRRAAALKRALGM
jgi:DNA-binding LytR/AlgR family response regulator